MPCIILIWICKRRGRIQVCKSCHLHCHQMHQKPLFSNCSSCLKIILLFLPLTLKGHARNSFLQGLLMTANSQSNFIDIEILSFFVCVQIFNCRFSSCNWYLCPGAFTESTSMNLILPLPWYHLPPIHPILPKAPSTCYGQYLSPLVLS